MKVKVLATGEVKHVSDGKVTDLLIDCGVLVRLQDDPAPEPPRGTAKWGLWDEDGNLTIVASCDVCSLKMRMNPRPNAAAVDKIVMWHCGHGAKVPADVAKAYIERGGGELPPFADQFAKPPAHYLAKDGGVK